MTVRPHGTNAKYHVEACRCDACRAAAMAYAANMRRQQAYGRWQPYVDAQPAREHVPVDQLGQGPKRIAEVSGVPHGSLAKLVYGDKGRGMGPSKRIRPATAEKILAVEPDPYPGSLVDGIGTRRRLRALVAAGYTQNYLAERIGYTRGNFGRLIHGKPGMSVEEGTRAAADSLYEELAMRLPAQDTPTRRRWVEHARQYAAARRWFPPLGLDDDRLDDPTYKRNREGTSVGLACRGCGAATKSVKRFCRPCWRERKAA